MDENLMESKALPELDSAALPKTETYAAPPRRQPPHKKKKTKRARLLQRRLIVLGSGLLVFFLIFSMGSAWRGGRSIKLTEENITAQLKALDALSTTSYHYTNMERFKDIEDFYGWDASDYSSFTLSYDGSVTASVDPAKAKVKIKGKQVTVTLPEATIQTNEIKEDSIAVFNSNQGKFEVIKLTDFAGFKKNQEPVAQAKATADGLLFDTSDKAKAAAKSLLESLAGEKSKYEIAIK